MKKIIVKLVLMASLLSTLLAFSASIKNIEILGLNVISRGTVLSYLPVEVGDVYDAQTSSKIIRVLYKTQFFKDIEVTEEEQILKIKVTENPHIKYVDFLNNSEKVLDKDTVKKVLISNKPSNSLSVFTLLPKMRIVLIRAISPSAMSSSIPTLF
jgi:outer membrane protein insertion porin family